jgi:hypothetical protein
MGVLVASRASRLWLALIADKPAEPGAAGKGWRSERAGYIGASGNASPSAGTGNLMTTRPPSHTSKPSTRPLALARPAHRREPIDRAKKLIGTNEVRPSLASHLED